MTNNTLTHEEFPLEELVFGEDAPERTDAAHGKAVSGAAPLAHERAVTVELPDDPIVARVATIMAQGLWMVVQEMEKSKPGRDQEFLEKVGRQQTKLEAAEAVLTDLAAKCDLVGNTQAALQEAHLSHKSAIEELKHESGNQHSSLASRMDTLGARIDAQEKELSALRAAMAESSPRMDGLAERLNRQAAAIRSLSEDNEQRRDAFQQVSNALSRLISLSSPVPSNEQL